MKSDLRHFFPAWTSRDLSKTSFNVIQSTNCSFSKKLNSFDPILRKLFPFKEYPNVNVSRSIFTQYVTFPPSGKVCLHRFSRASWALSNAENSSHILEDHLIEDLHIFLGWKITLNFVRWSFWTLCILRFHCASAPRRSTRVTFLWSEKRRLTVTIVRSTLQRELMKLPRISISRRNRWMILSRLSGSKMVKRSKFHTQILKFFSICHRYVCVA